MTNANEPAPDWTGHDNGKRALRAIQFLYLHEMLTDREYRFAMKRLSKWDQLRLPAGPEGTGERP